MAGSSRLGWYATRLRTMGPAEISWRLGRAARGVAAPVSDRVADRRLAGDDGRWDRALTAFREARDRPVLLDRARARAVAAAAPDEVDRLVAAAEQVRRHRVQYFGYPEVHLGDRIDWHLDPLSGHRWPRVPASRLDHRTAPADVKWIWELNRLQHLPWLAQAWLATGRDELATEALEELDSWLDQNPVGEGIAWRGAFEAGVRAVSVLVALQGLRDCEALTVDRFRRVATMLDRSARLCWSERSRFSSANNHLVGEMAGLAVIGLLLPDLPGAQRRVDRALRVLGEEAGLQVLPDGAGAEQAVGYQMFTVELLLVVMVLLREAGRPVPPALDRAVTRSTGYLASVVGGGDPAPRYGDDDEGFALRLGVEEVRTVTDHLAIVGAYAGAADVPGAGGLTATWVRAATAGTTTTVRVPEPVADLHAADGGLVVLRRGDQRVTVDVAPLGFLAIAAHGHADALSLTWSVGGREVVGDPGTGSYYGHPAWRVVHRGTPAHATVTVDGLDQSVIAGAFMWTHHAEVRTRRVDLGEGLVDAEHDGYTRLDAPVVHRRVVRVLPDLPGLVVVDQLRAPDDVAPAEHEATVSWPVAPDLVSRAVDDGHLLSRDGAPVAQLLVAGTVPLRHDHVHGDEETHLGWWSDRLEQRRPSYLARSRAGGPVPLVVATLLVAADGAEPRPVTGLRVDARPGEVRLTWDAAVCTGSRSLIVDLT